MTNTHKKTRKDATTDQAELQYQSTLAQIQLRAYEIYFRARSTGWIRSRRLVSSRERAKGKWSQSQNLLDEIALADKVGLDVFGAGEHHRTDAPVFLCVFNLESL